MRISEDGGFFFVGTSRLRPKARDTPVVGYQPIPDRAVVRNGGCPYYILFLAIRESSDVRTCV